MLTAVIFAAGRGTRLRPITNTIPKPLVTILDVPLIDLALRAVRPPATEIIVNTSHLGPALRAYLKHRPGVTVSDEGAEPFGTGGTLLDLRERLSPTFITYNCDLVSDLDVSRVVDEHEGSGKLATLACTPVETEADLVTDRGRIALVDRRERSVAGYRFIGCAVFEERAIDLLKSDPPVGLTEGLLRPLLDRDEVGLHIHHGYAQDAGTPARLIQVNKDAAAGRIAVPHEGEILTLDGGFAFRGRDALAQEEAFGPGAIVGARAKVAEGASISDAIVWAGETIPPVTITDAIYFKGEQIDATR